LKKVFFDHPLSLALSSRIALQNKCNQSSLDTIFWLIYKMGKSWKKDKSFETQHQRLFLGIEKKNI